MTSSRFSYFILIFILIFIVMFTGCLNKPSDQNEEQNADMMYEKIEMGQNNLSNPTDIAKFVLERRFGKNWTESYQIGTSIKYITISQHDTLVRIVNTRSPYFTPKFTLLIANGSVYFLTSEDFNKYLQKNGGNINLEDNDIVYRLINDYFILFGARNEHIFTNNDLKGWTESQKIKYNIEPDNLNRFVISKQDDGVLVNFHSAFSNRSLSTMPASYELIITEYEGKIGPKGDVSLKIINSSSFKEFGETGPRY